MNEELVFIGFNIPKQWNLMNILQFKPIEDLYIVSTQPDVIANKLAKMMRVYYPLKDMQNLYDLNKVTDLVETTDTIVSIDKSVVDTWLLKSKITLGSINVVNYATFKEQCYKVMENFVAQGLDNLRDVHYGNSVLVLPDNTVLTVNKGKMFYLGKAKDRTYLIKIMWNYSKTKKHGKEYSVPCGMLNSAVEYRGL